MATETNEYGMTFSEWRAAAGLLALDTATRERMIAAWREGEDPTDWRAANENPVQGPIYNAITVTTTLPDGYTVTRMQRGDTFANLWRRWRDARYEFTADPIARTLSRTEVNGTRLTLTFDA